MRAGAIAKTEPLKPFVLQKSKVLRRFVQKAAAGSVKVETVLSQTKGVGE